MVEKNTVKTGSSMIRCLATQMAGFEKPGGHEKLLFKPGTQWHYSLLWWRRRRCRG